MELFKILGTIAIDNKDANASINETTGHAEKSESKISSAMKKIGTAVATYFAVDKIKAFGSECVDMASNVQEVQNKFDVVFQGMTEDVETWAKTYADSVGRNRNTIKEYLADNQNMFVGMGMTREEGAKLSEQMVELGLDLASFNNLQEDDAVNALSKALMGETESAKRLGAVLNENTIAMAQEQLGYKGKFKDLTEAQKMEVRYQAILNQSQDAVGDCARSLDSYKGRQIQAQAAMENLKETIGTRLIPYMTKLQEKFGAVALRLGDYVNPAFDKLEKAASIVGTFWRNVLEPAVADVGEAFSEIWDALQPVIQSFTDMLPEVEGNVDVMDIFRTTCLEIADALKWFADQLLVVAEWISENQTAVEVMVTIIGSVAAAVLLVNGAVTAWNVIAGIATGVTTALGSAVAFLTSPIGIAIAAIAAIIAIGVLLYKNWDTIKEKAAIFGEKLSQKFNEIKTKVAEKFEEIKEKISSTMNSIWSKITEIWEDIKLKISTKISSIVSTISNKFNEAKDTVTDVFNKIKDTITEKIQAAKDTVYEAIEKIKSFFNFEWKLPDLKLPHIRIDGEWNLAEGKFPSFGVDWYAKGAVLNKPTVFGMNGNNAMVGGEAGAEAVAPIDVLQRYVSEAVEAQNAGLADILLKILAAIYSMDDSLRDKFTEAMENMRFDINNREFARLVKAVN